MEPVSAFSVYAAKRKNTEQLSEKNEKRKKHKAFNKKQNDIEKTNIRQKIQCKERTKSTKELNSVNNGVPLSKINKIQNIHSKSKLKAMKKRKKKNKKNADKRGTIQMIDTVSMENIRTESRENNLNNTDSSYSNNTNLSHTNHATNASIKIHSERNPIQDTQQVLKWMLYPMIVEDFFEKNWEKTPVYVKRGMCNYYKHVLSTPMLDETLRNNYVLFTKNIDVTSYSNGVRETHNPSGRAFPSIVWDYYRNKCSVRMLNPQTFMPRIHALNATLQEAFGCFVGANIYLTPPNSQGFAPHYDDVEAFILQVEGQKRWKLYKPLKWNEYLPRYSSRNFDQSEIGEPILDTIVKAGDLLYLPRGTIHQGMTLKDTHSLHITLSVYQKNSWCDLLEKVLPQALKQATEKDIRFREGLPLDYLTYVGSAHAESYRKNDFKNDVKNLIILLLEHIDIDNAADLMAKNHIHDFLPPYVFKVERTRTVMEDGEVMTDNGLVKNFSEFTLQTEIRLLRMHCIRLIKEDVYKIYYSTENSKEYHEYELQFLEIDKIFVPAIKHIIVSYPNFISVGELPLKSDDVKIQIVKDLWEKNLIRTKNPLR